MKIRHETATNLVLMAPFDDATSAGSAQDIASRIEGVLDPQPEPDAKIDDGVLDDGASLPDNDDPDSDDDKGSVDEDGEGEGEGEPDADDLTLASYLGVDEEKLIVKDDGSVVFNAIIDGEAKEVDLKELAKSYQLQGHVNNKSISLENDKKEFEQVKNTAYTEMKSRLDGVANLQKVLESQLVNEYNAVDWERLRAQDPAEWTALRQEFSDRATKMQQATGEVAQESQRLAKEQQDAHQLKMNAGLEEQLGYMIEDNPTWSDEAVMATEVGKIGSFLSETYNFKAEDLAMVRDRRLIRLIQDAKAYREGKKGIADKKLVAKNLPKFQKPGASSQQTANLTKARAIKAQRKAVKDSGGSVESIANSLLNRM